MEAALARCSSLAGLAALALLASGCGKGPSPSPSPSPSPGPAPGPVGCLESLQRGHCSHCDRTGTVCLGCRGSYNLNAKPSSPALSCTFNCSGFVPPKPPDKPSHAQAHNGVEWPAVCIQESVSRFLTIGDWGGLCGWGAANKCEPGVVPPSCPGGTSFGEPGRPCPMPNRPGSAFVPEVEQKAQWLVSARMLERARKLKAQNTPARFIVNVGDNFYPGGIDVHCGKEDMTNRSTQFEQIWKSMYPGELTQVEWWSVLGNHDYGGVCYIKGWDQQIFYTWHQDNWVLPGQYWRRSAQYSNFKADFFFIDGNVFDATPHTDEDHNICSKTNNPGPKCDLNTYPGDGSTCAVTGPTSPADCIAWFRELWGKTYQWLRAGLAASDADWQIIVNHYPANFNLGYAPESYMTWSNFLSPMGVDLFISGHTHEQRVYYGDFGLGKNMGETAWVVTGGGGGVTSEILPSVDGHDDAYGFMEVELSLEALKITAYSHGGTRGEVIVRNQTTVAPVPRKSREELIAAGILGPTPRAVEATEGHSDGTQVVGEVVKEQAALVF